MGAMASQITTLTIVYWIVYSDRSKKTSKLRSLAFVRGINRWPVMRKIFAFDYVIIDSFVHLIFSLVAALNHEMASKVFKYTFATSEISLTEKIVNMGFLYNRNEVRHQ